MSHHLRTQFVRNTQSQEPNSHLSAIKIRYILAPSAHKVTKHGQQSGRRYGIASHHRCLDCPSIDPEFSYSNDALRKHGILPPKEAPPPSPSPPPSPTLSDLLDDELPGTLEALSGEAPDSDTERMIQAYKRQRISEIKAEEKKSRFGEVYPIGREDYAREVTEGSKADEIGAEAQGQGTGVVCFLYRDG